MSSLNYKDNIDIACGRWLIYYSLALPLNFTTMTVMLSGQPR